MEKDKNQKMENYAKKFEEIINNLEMPKEDEEFYIFYSLRNSTPSSLLKEFKKRLTVVEILEKYDLHFGYRMTDEDWVNLIEKRPSMIFYGFCMVENYDVGLGLISFADKLGKETYLERERKKRLYPEQISDDEWDDEDYSIEDEN
jgi:hypothetical protein